MMTSVSQFMDENFKHFNARETVDAARGYKKHLSKGGKMLVAVAGAMSTGELGISLAQMIREDKVHAISCTAANLEEDIFNLLAHDEYRMCPEYRDLSPKDEQALRDEGYNRVTDTCIPEAVMKEVDEQMLVKMWIEASEKGESYFPYEYYYRAIKEHDLKSRAQIPPENSWVVAAYEKNIPIFSPGFEDSTLGNMVCAEAMKGRIKHSCVKSGTEQMELLAGPFNHLSLLLSSIFRNTRTYTRHINRRTS